ncbi:hypothetical protein ACHAP8_003693 [Fusarium lateritium]
MSRKTLTYQEIGHLGLKTADFTAAHKLAFISIGDFIAMSGIFPFRVFLVLKVGVEEGESLGLAHQKAKAWGQSLLLLNMEWDRLEART